MPQEYQPLDNPTKNELKAIAEKMSSGLTREQAEQVIRDQRTWEAHPEHPKNKKAEAPVVESGASEEKPSKGGSGAK